MSARLPAGPQVFLDHVAHFVPDAVAAEAALRACGFTTTPFSVQTAPAVAGGPPVPTGTGNVCAMLERGYVEVLARTSDTPLARELEAAVGRWPGVHLAAFAVADAAAAHHRLLAAGFDLRPLVHLSRPVETETGAATAAFSVVRPEPGQMPEGRIQILAHHTEAAVWQPRWLGHPNGVVGLRELVIVTAEPEAAAGRFGRFLDRWPGEGGLIELDRGALRFVAPGTIGLDRPGLPWLAAYVLEVLDLTAAGRAFAAGGAAPIGAADALWCPFPPALGRGAWVLVGAGGHHFPAPV